MERERREWSPVSRAGAGDEVAGDEMRTAGVFLVDQGENLICGGQTGPCHALLGEDCHHHQSSNSKLNRLGNVLNYLSIVNSIASFS